MRNPELEAVTEQLAALGIKHATEDDGPHLKVRWWHSGRPRVVVCAKTGSDWRGPANARALTRRLLREDGHDLSALPAPRPRVSMLERALAAPAPTDTTPERLSKLEAEQRYVADLLLQIAPAFDAILDTQAPLPDARPRAYRVALELAPAKLGLVLASLYSLGLAPSEVDVAPLGTAAPLLAPAAKPHVNGARRPQGARTAEIVAALRDHGPMTSGEMRKVLCVPKEEEHAFSMALTYTKKQGLARPDARRGGPWQLINEGRPPC